MGRTNPTFRDNVRRFRERWQPFRRALRKQYQDRFDALVEQGERFADVAGFQNPSDADTGILVSMLLGQPVDLHELEDREETLEERIHCQPYTEDQLVDILRMWCDAELEAVEFEESGLIEVANVADGDARVAITTLRIAARQEEQPPVNRIDTDVFEDALPEDRRKLRETQIKNLTPDQQAVFEVVAEEGSITSGDPYGKYQSRVKEPKSDRTVRNYLDKLERYDLVETEGFTRDRVYRCTATGAMNQVGSSV